MRIKARWQIIALLSLWGVTGCSLFSRAAPTPTETIPPLTSLSSTAMTPSVITVASVATDTWRVYLPLTLKNYPPLPTPTPTATPLPPLVWDPELDTMNVYRVAYNPTPDETYWRLIRTEYLGPEESNLRHNIYYAVEDENGNAILGQTVCHRWPDGEYCTETTPTGGVDGQPGANFGMYASYDPYEGESGPYSAWVDGLGSDEVWGMGLPLNHHVCFVLTWRRATAPQPSPTPSEIPPTNTPTNTPTATAPATNTPTETVIPDHTITASPTSASTPTGTPVPTATALHTPTTPSVTPTKTTVPTATASRMPTTTATPTDTATATFTPSPTNTATPESGCANYVVNGGFEQAGAWTIAASAYPADYVETPAHDGRRAMRLGIPSDQPDATTASALWQDVAIPANALSATLSFWFYPQSADAIFYDYYECILYDTEFNLLEVPMPRENNHDERWTTRTFNLLPWRGTTVRVYFNVHNDSGGFGTTRIYLDDVNVEVCQ